MDLMQQTYWQEMKRVNRILKTVYARLAQNNKNI